MDSSIGVFLIVAGVAIRLFAGRRKFYRTNKYGKEEFSNYTSKTTNGCLDRTGGLIAGCLIILGIIFVFIGCLNNDRFRPPTSQKKADTTLRVPH